ncbi:MAG: hypothetical protein HY735_32905 [Verrucomicrobia bacterium]|nr:hypothetical protein [Verrucomicrobiota bacterium]
MPPEHSPESREIISRFEKLLVALARSGVDFAVVGGLAVILNGYPRLTLDADIIVNEGPDNIRRLLKCLEGWGEGWARELKVEEFISQEGSIRVMEDFDLDIFTRMRGKSLDDFRPSLRYVELSGARVPILDPASLVYLKTGSWRDKDKLDVLAMQEILERERKRRL